MQEEGLWGISRVDPLPLDCRQYALDAGLVTVKRADVIPERRRRVLRAQVLMTARIQRHDRTLHEEVARWLGSAAGLSLDAALPKRTSKFFAASVAWFCSGAIFEYHRAFRLIVMEPFAERST